MAKDSLGDHLYAVNQCCPFCNNPLNEEDIDWQDLVADNIAKTKALVAVATWEGISKCDEATQHHYLSVLDDLLTIVARGFRNL